MSKYRDRGDYHYREFADPKTPYHHHVNDFLVHFCKHVQPQEDAIVLDVGCGEGLFLEQLKKRNYNAIGCDVDSHAITIAQSKGHRVWQGGVQQFENEKYQAVLLMDVLEHVLNLHDVLGHASDLAPMVFVAIPDRPDAHAVRDIDPVDIGNFFLDKGWKCLHSDQRHARHFMIFKHE